MIGGAADLSERGMSGFEIATVGDNCIDRYLPLRQSAVGGNAVNVAVQLRRLGREVGYFGAVGDDADGRRVLACLEARGVDTGRVLVRPGRTAVTDLDIDAAGDRIIAFEDFGACAGYRPPEADRARLRRMRHVHLGWLDDGGALRRELAAAGVSVSQDLAVNPGAEGLAIAFGSAGESRERARQIAREFLDQGARIAVVTCGARGSVAVDAAAMVEADAAPVEVVDTTGAGDTFIAAFIDAHLAGHGLSACLEAARHAAALTCRHVGGFAQPLQPLAG